MARFFLIIATVSLLLTSCLSQEKGVTIMKTDERALLESPKVSAPPSTDTASGTKTAPMPAVPAGNDTDASANGEVSPESDVVTPIGAPES